MSPDYYLVIDPQDDVVKFGYDAKVFGPDFGHDSIKDAQFNDEIEGAERWVVRGVMLAKPASTWKHVKTGGLYRFLHGAQDAGTGEPVVVYQALTTGVVWVRLAREFYDGRFLKVQV